MRRGVSGLIAILILGIVMTGLISTAIILNNKIHSSLSEGAGKATRLISDASQPPVLSLYPQSGSLYVEVLSSRPMAIEGFIVEKGKFIGFKPYNGILSGVSRLELVENYSCEPVRVYAVLESGLIIPYDPRRDPRIGFIPVGWNGMWECSLGSLEASIGGLYEPRVWSEVFGSGGGGNSTVTMSVGWGRIFSETILVGASKNKDRYTWDECLVKSTGSNEKILDSFYVNGSRVDVVLGCTQGWPKAVYLAFRGPDGIIFSGRVEFNYSIFYATLASFNEDSPYTRRSPSDPWVLSLAGPIPVSYTPLGTSWYKAVRSFETGQVFTNYWRGYFRYEGWGVMDYERSTLLVLIAWSSLKPDWFTAYYNEPYVELMISRLYIRVYNATLFKPDPVSWDLGVSEALKAKLYKYNLTAPPVRVYDIQLSPQGLAPVEALAPEPWSEAIYKVYKQLLPGAPRVEIVGEAGNLTSTRLIPPGGVVELAFPGARFKINAYPYWHPPLYNGLQATYRDEQIIGATVVKRVYEGRVMPAPNPTPWRGPAVLEVEVPGRTPILAILSWPGILEIKQANITFKGYAQLLGDQAYTVTPNNKLRIALTIIDYNNILITTYQVIDARRGWNENLEAYRGEHVILTIMAEEPESIIAWIN